MRPALVALCQRLIDRLEARGCRTGRLPELHLAVDGRRLDLARIAGDRHRFVLPARYRDLRLVSAMGALAWTRADSFDRRLLGVSVLAVDWVERGVPHRLDLADASLFADGWHGLDGRGARTWRWTDGNARLAIENAASVEVTLGSAVTRWLPPADPAVARNRSTA